jgi:flagellar biosynthesis protein FlhG
MEIWAVAGGKGGTGKSFLSSAFALALAGKGKSVILIDCDFGGANLHSYLGIKRPELSLKHFFTENISLADIAMETNISGLQLIPGTINSSTGDNFKYFQKLKFFRHIKKLDCDFVIMDLGAGTGNNTIDTFLIADKKIAVTLPDKMAVENFYFFTKAAFFRKLGIVLKSCNCKEEGIKLWQYRQKYKITSLRDYVISLRNISKQVEKAVDEEITSFRIKIILNQIRDFAETEAGLAIKSMLLKFMGIQSDFLGAVRYDRSLWSRLKRQDAYINFDSASRLMPEVEGIVNKLQ